MKKTLFIGISLLMMATFIGLLYAQPKVGVEQRVESREQDWVETLTTEIDEMVVGMFSENPTKGDSLQQIVAYFSPKRP